MTYDKQLFMIGGPNGAGKTTSAFKLMPELIHCYEYVNADAIAASLSPFNQEALVIKSGKLMLSRIRELISKKVTFAFEATMASKGFVSLLRQCKQQGYQINLLYIWVISPELAVERVHQRTLSGGHPIPPDVIKRRYYRSVNNFINKYISIADRWVLCDNSTAEPHIIAQKFRRHNKLDLYDEELWQYFTEYTDDKTY